LGRALGRKSDVVQNIQFDKAVVWSEMPKKKKGKEFSEWGKGQKGHACTQSEPLVLLQLIGEFSLS